MTEYVAIPDVKIARALVKRTVGKVSKTNRTQTVDAAYATDVAYAHGLIGSGEGALYPTARAYAEAMLVSPATVTLWRRLGHALVVGVTPDSGLWQTLAFRAAANDKSVAEAILAEDATVATIQAAVDLIRNPDGSKRDAVKGAARPADGSKGEGEATDVLAGVTDPTEQAMILVKMLDKIVKGTDREGWAKIESALDKIVKREVTVRAKADKAEAAKATAA